MSAAFIKRRSAISIRILTIILVFFLLFPVGVAGQSGDASWLNNHEGLETAIGRSWMAPISFTTTSTLTEFNADGTPVLEQTTQSTPESTPIQSNQYETLMLSALIYEFDSADNAEAGLKLFTAETEEQIRRDPRSPAIHVFTPDLGDTAIGHQGELEIEGIDGELQTLAVVYVLVQHDNLIYQVFGQFVPGSHIELATGVAASMLNAETGTDEPIYDANGASTGGLWEKLNAVDIPMPAESTVTDLEIYPPGEDAVRGDSVVVPEIDLAHVAEIPGLTNSWHIRYAPEDTGTPAATPSAAPAGAFNIELWVMEFSDPTSATAAAFSLGPALTQPLAIMNSSFKAEDDGSSPRVTMENVGFVQDRSLPEGEAAVIIVVEGSTVYAARVYTGDSAPMPIARELISRLIETDAGSDDETVSGTTAQGGRWQKFPQAGDVILHSLEPTLIRHDEPGSIPAATPAG